MARQREKATIETSPGGLVDDERRRGRGARSNHTGRFEAERREAFDDGWEGLGDLDAFKTTVFDDPARTIITATTAPTSRSTARSIPIAAASMAASIASRGRRTASSAIRPASTSKPS